LWLFVCCAAVTPVLCADLPVNQTNADVNGWNVSCSNATVDTNCTLACADGSTGPGYTAVCTANGNWSVSGTCAGERLLL